MLGGLRCFFVYLSFFQVACADLVSFDKKGYDFWPSYIFEVFDKYVIQINVPPDGWEGDHTKRKLSVTTVKENNILISIFYDFQHGVRKIPRTELFLGVSKKSGEISSGNIKKIGQRFWSRSDFHHSNAGMIYESALDDDYIIYVTLSMSPSDYANPNFLKPRVEVLELILQSVSITEN